MTLESSHITVILPVYNGERYLTAAIRSVLEKTLPPEELIMVDDRSTDGSAAIVARIQAAAPPIRRRQLCSPSCAFLRRCALSAPVGQRYCQRLQFRHRLDSSELLAFLSHEGWCINEPTRAIHPDWTVRTASGLCGRCGSLCNANAPHHRRNHERSP